jgi:uncharacterized protein YecE (DUF72 family)
MPTRRKAAPAGCIRVGIGGWTFEPWRGTFYPEGLPHARELDYASRHLTSIEINGTFYRTQKPATFRAWHDETPDDFVFAVKAPRYATHRRVLAEAGDSIARFLDSGLLELKSKLGPILWQLMPTAKFDAADMTRPRMAARRSATRSRCGTRVSPAPNSCGCCASATSRSSPWSPTSTWRSTT